MKNLFETFDSEATLKLVDNEYLKQKRFSKEEREVTSVDDVKYYYYAGKDDEDIRKLSKFLKPFQDKAFLIAEANERETNCENIDNEDDLDEFDEVGYVEYKCFQVYLFEYNAE